MRDLSLAFPFGFVNGTKIDYIQEASIIGEVMNLYTQLVDLLAKLEKGFISIDQFEPALIDFAKTGLSVFLTKEDFLHWVNSPSIDCQWRCPKDLMNSISEIKDVTSILNRISHGIPY